MNKISLLCVMLMSSAESTYNYYKQGVLRTTMKATKPIHLTIALSICFTLLLPMIAQGNEVPYWSRTVPGYKTYDEIGDVVSNAGDVNQDGYNDFVVGAKWEHTNELDFDHIGSVRVYSGQDNSVLYEYLGAGDLTLLGASVSGAGDVNNDGYPDFMAAEGRGVTKCFVVYSGLNGSVLYSKDAGMAYQGGLNFEVSGAGDVNNDGYADFITRVWYQDTGLVTVYSGQDGTEMFVINESGAISDLGDVNADGYDEFIVGLSVYNGQDGSVLYSVLNGSKTKVNSIGDINGDGTPDIITASGLEAWVSNGVDASVLHHVTFGCCAGVDSMRGVSDVNGDGYNDFLIGFGEEASSHGNKTGAIRLFSGADASLLHFSIGDSPFDNFGISVAGLGDLDGDGKGDFIVGASYDDNGGHQSGAVRIFYSSEPVQVTNDVDFDADGDMVFQDNATGSVVLWFLQDASKAAASWLGNFVGTSINAIADIDADGDTDLLLQNITDQSVSALIMENGEAFTTLSVGSQSGYTLSYSSGDFDSDYDQDLVFEDGTGNIIIWLVQNGIKDTSTWLGTWSGQSVAAVGDIDNDGDDDIITQDTSGNVNVIEMEDGAKVAARWVGQWAGRTIVGAGDADNDGDADIFMESTSPSGDVMVIEMQNGLKVTGRWLGTWVGTEVKAIGDIDQDGDVDLIQQNTSTGSVQVVEIENANKVAGRWLGTYAYDVKGVIDADGDGDVDVAMQDGSGNVALIELENGSKVGGAKWLGVNAGEMKLFP